jgi:hypothetical protein
MLALELVFGVPFVFLLYLTLAVIAARVGHMLVKTGRELSDRRRARR